MDTRLLHLFVTDRRSDREAGITDFHRFRIPAPRTLRVPEGTRRTSTEARLAKCQQNIDRHDKKDIKNREKRTLIGLTKRQQLNFGMPLLNFGI